MGIFAHRGTTAAHLTMAGCEEEIHREKAARNLGE